MPVTRGLMVQYWHGVFTHQVLTLQETKQCHKLQFYFQGFWLVLWCSALEAETGKTELRVHTDEIDVTDFYIISVQ